MAKGPVDSQIFVHSCEIWVFIEPNLICKHVNPINYGLYENLFTMGGGIWPAAIQNAPELKIGTGRRPVLLSLLV